MRDEGVLGRGEQDHQLPDADGHFAAAERAALEEAGGVRVAAAAAGHQGGGVAAEKRAEHRLAADGGRLPGGAAHDGQAEPDAALHERLRLGQDQALFPHEARAQVMS